MTDPIIVSADSLKVVGSLLRFAPGRLDDRSWNALIGVVTAIVGNILISFALNLQRYAHIRLQKEQRQRSKPWNRASGNAHKRPEYGAISEVNGHGTRRDDRTNASPERQPLLNNASPQSRPLRTDSGLSRRTDSGLSSWPATSYEEEDEQKSYLKSPYWWAGIFLMTIGEAGNFLAYGFAPASTVSPLGVVALISNCIIAPCLLHERYRQRDFWGVLVAVAGAVTIVMSAESNEAKMGPSEIWDAISRWEFELYLGITAAAIVVLAWASPKYGNKTLLIDLGLVGLFGKSIGLSVMPN
jgi:magnesium transporter